MSGLVGANAGTNETMVQLRELERESETYRTLYQTFMQRYQEALQQQSFPVNEARIITAATPPIMPSYPKRGLILALSLVLGAMVGCGPGRVARISRPRVSRRRARSRRARARIPRHAARRRRAGDVQDRPRTTASDPDRSTPPIRCCAIRIDHPLSSFAETLRAAKVAVDLALGDRQPKVDRHHFRAAQRGQVDGRQELRLAARPSWRANAADRRRLAQPGPDPRPGAPRRGRACSRPSAAISR